MSDWLAADRTDLAADRILDAAAALFSEKGVATVGMADVAKAAGCSRATLYRYFENRRALQYAVVNRESRRIGAAVVADVKDVHESGGADRRDCRVGARAGARGSHVDGVVSHRQCGYRQ